MVELMALALAGLLAGAALGAAKRRAPRALVVVLLAMAGLAFVLT